MKKDQISKLTLGAFFIALGIALPFLTGQVPQIGSMLLPMHIPVLLCGIVCGPVMGLIVGFVIPLLRSVTIGMPYLFPTAIAMAFELATYGIVIGMLYKMLNGKRFQVYLSLLGSMVAGRIVYGVAMSILLGVSGGAYTYEIFIAGAVTGAIPGIILQFICIPVIIHALQASKLVKFTAI